MMRHSGLSRMAQMIEPSQSPSVEQSLRLVEQERLIATNLDASGYMWRSMTRDAEVYARAGVRHKDHRTIDLCGGHRVYMNRGRFAYHGPQIALLD